MKEKPARQAEGGPKVEAVRILSVNVRPTADVQTRAAAQAIERHTDAYVYLSGEDGDAIHYLRQGMRHYREEQQVTGEWIVEYALCAIGPDRRLSGAFSEYPRFMLFDKLRGHDELPKAAGGN